MQGSFWSFSLKVYAAPDVGDECISLQDGYGIDVNLLLFAAFLGTNPKTVQSWEQGLRTPSPMARRFMDEINRSPAHWRNVLSQTVPS